METILREVLAEDKSLLCRRDELTAALEKKIPPNKSRDFASIKRALSFNVGEKFFVGDDADREATKAEVAKILKDGGLQEARIDFVINTFVKALDWDKPKIPVSEKKIDTVKDAESKNVSETFTPPAIEKQSPPPQQSPPKSSPQQQPTKPTYQPPPQQTTATQSSGNKKILIGVACVAVLAIGFMAGRSLDSSMSTPPPASETTTQQAETTPPIQQEETKPTLPPKPPPEDNSYLNARTDLSLNGMDLNIPVSEAEKILGRPNKIEKVDGYDRYIYSDNFYIAVINGKVDAFVTRDPKFKTKRGVHVGSTYSEVIDKYGTNSQDMNLDDLVLHEYPFTSFDGKYSLLRFAIDNNGRVNYISIRIVEEPSPSKTNKVGGIFEARVKGDIDFLSLRRNPSVNSPEVTRIPPGSQIEVTVTGDVSPGSFMPVTYSGRKGYAHNSYFTIGKKIRDLP